MRDSLDRVSLLPPAGGIAHGGKEAWWQPWTALAAFGFLLHFVWELLQVPLYRDMSTMPHWRGILTCASATLGDVVIQLSAYAVSALIARDSWWALGGRRRAMGVYVAIGLGATVVLEWVNVYVRGRWGYAPIMPQLLGIGLSPLAQWLVVPPVTVWLARRHLAGAPGSFSPSNMETSS